MSDSKIETPRVYTALRLEMSGAAGSQVHGRTGHKQRFCLPPFLCVCRPKHTFMAEKGSSFSRGEGPEAKGNAATRTVSDSAPPSGVPSSSDSPTLVDIPSQSASDSPTMVEGISAVSAHPPSSARPPSSEFQPTQVVLQPGTLLAQRYEILQMLGEGGMGAVYKARDRDLNRLVALKVIRPEFAGNESIIQRFKQELILARQVTHKNVIRIYDMGESEGMRFITMEYVDGEDLRALIRQHGKLPPDQAVEIMQQVCRALEAAHAEGVIHRDLKPQNVMRDKQGRILVMDFGLARSLDAEGMTQTGALIGTMEYMSPEQAMGNSLDQRSDLFTLGLIFYELLTGNLPFKADTALASLLRRTRERAVPISQVNREVPQDLSNVVSKCLERDANQRYQTVQDLLKDLELWKQNKRVSVSSAGIMMSRLREVEWTKAALAALVLVIVVAGTWYWTRSRTKPQAAVAPRSVLVADFQNKTGDGLFDGTLEPMVNVALEGASFINAYNRGSARKLAGKLATPSDKLDENTARLVAVSQGLSAIVTGSLESQGSGYKLSLNAIDAVTGKVLGTSDGTAENKDQVLLEVPKIAAPIRKALGDTTPESVQLAATQGSFAASNLEAVHYYGVGMEQQSAGKMQDALQSFSKAAELDPNFARAYAGMAATSRSLGNTQNSENYIKLALAHVDRMSERERYRIRGLYYLYSGDYGKCVDEYGALVKLYPADNLGHNNLAGCYNELRNFPKALEEMRSALQTTPNSSMYKLNVSILSTYTGDFQNAEQQAQSVIQANPAFEQAYEFLAYAPLGQGRMDDAAQTYQAVGKLSPLGASMSASGLADVALYEGRYSEAVRLLESGAAADVAAKNSRETEKLAVLAHAQLLRGNNGPALEAAKRALASTQKANARLLVAQVLIQAGKTQEADVLAKTMSSELSPEAQADAKLIQGEIALHEKDARKAIQLFSEGNKVLDTWMGHYDLGRAYLDAGLNVEANSEFDLGVKNRGLAMELLDGPTYGYFPPTYYYLGRSEQGLGSPGAADSYQKLVSIQSKGDGGAVLDDAKKRLAELGAKK